MLEGTDLLGDNNYGAKKAYLAPELVAHPSRVVTRDVELLEAEEELEVVEVLVVDVKDWVLPEDTKSFDCESGGAGYRRT